MSEDSKATRAKANATFRELVVELAKIAAAEDDAAERHQDIATP